MDGFDAYRSEFPIIQNYAFMNHAAVSPLSLRVVKAAEGLFHEFSHCGIACYPNWKRRISEVRQLFAELIKADAHEIAFIANTSAGLSTISSGLQWKEGDGVLVPEPDFPTNIYPWMNLERQGVVTRFIPRKQGRFGIRDIEKALSPGTRLISVSSVDFSTGFLCDLEAIGDFCRRKGLLFCVDAIQSLGVIPMDVKKYGIHFLAAAAHKWLLSTMGCGGLFVSKEVMDLIHPRIVGWRSVTEEEDFFRIHFDLKPDALRFESGTLNVAGIYALGAAIDLFLEVGVDKVYDKVLRLNDVLCEGLSARHLQVVTSMVAGERSGILSFIPNSDPKCFWNYLNKNRIMTSLRGGMIRLSPHFYNNRDDILQLFKAIDRA